MAYFITPQDLQNADLVTSLHRNLSVENYWNDHWSGDLYSSLAYEGFISITVRHPELQRPVLFSQLQRSYAVLDWENLHLSRHVIKIIKSDNKYYLTLNRDFARSVRAVQRFHFPSWLTDEYRDLLLSLKKENTVCRPLSVELRNDEGDLLAGEIGYQIGGIYTSLSGFSGRRKEHANLGTLQMVLLAKLLERRGFLFWNLGHPYMEYKLRLGARILERPVFLDKWISGRDLEIPRLEGGCYAMENLCSGL